MQSNSSIRWIEKYYTEKFCVEYVICRILRFFRYSNLFGIISADDHVVFLGHSGLLGEVFGCEPLEVAMGIAGSFAYYIISCST